MGRAGPKIQRAEVLSFRLEIPLPAFQQISEEGGMLTVEVRQEEEGERVLAVTEGRCSMRFSIDAGRARLVELELVDDERGLFLQRVVGPLMLQGRGDLHARLYWNIAERNRDGDFAEIRIHAGETDYPGLGAPRNSMAGASAGGGGTEPLFRDDSAPPPARPMTADDEKVAKLLAKARTYWDEYQRLKRERAST